MSDSTHSDAHHITSATTLIATFVALVALTLLTSALAMVQLGAIDIWVTLGIATLKAGLVAAIFMHLRHDKALNGIILMGTLLFAMLFIAFALTDTTEYQPEIDQYNENLAQEAANLEG